MSNGNIKLSVKSARLLDDESVLNHDRLTEQMLAPHVPLPLPAGPVEAPIDQGEDIAQSPESLAPAEDRAFAPAPAAPQHDYAAELARAQSKANDNAFLARSGRAAQTLIEGGTGFKGGGQFHDELLRDADQPVDDLKMRIDIGKHVDNLQKTADEGNPSSRTSHVAREQLRAIDPRAASMLGKSLEQMSANDVAKYMGVRTKDLQLDALLEKQRSNDEIGRLRVHNAELERQRKEFEYRGNHPLNEQKADAATTNASANMLKARTMQEGAAAGTSRGAMTQGRHVDNFLAAYNRDSSKLQPIAATMTEIERQAPGLLSGKAPPNVHFGTFEAIMRQVPKGFGGHITPQEDIVLGSTLKKLMVDIRHSTAGANLTPEERNDYEDVFQSALGAPPEVKAAVLSAFREKLYNELSTKWAAYEGAIPEDRQKRFYAQGGFGPMSPLFKDIAARRDSTSTPPGPQPRGAPPLDTSTPVREPGQPSAETVRVRRRGDTGPGKVVPAAQAAVFMNNPNYEIVNAP